MVFSIEEVRCVEAHKADCQVSKVVNKTDSQIKILRFLLLLPNTGVKLFSYNNIL